MLEVAGGALRQKRPVVSQLVDGRVEPIQGGYVVVPTSEESDSGPHVTFAIGPYDATRTLVIDPVLVFSTYFGGSAADRGTQMEIDDTGVYIFGQTMSADLPSTGGSAQPGHGGNTDAFVAKFTFDGTALVYCTYLGGSGTEDPFVAAGLAIDKHGNAILGSRTDSLDFPMVEPFQASYGGGISDGFIAKLSADGSTLLYSSYLGGSNTDQVEIVAVDAAGHAYLSGATSSADFPTRKAFQATYGGGPADLFVTKVHVHGKLLHYSTYLGGAGRDDFSAIAVDAYGQAHVSGRTNSADFPTVAAFQPSFGGGPFDVVAAKFAEDGQSLIYSTYLGGSGRDEDRNITIDANGELYLVGVTSSTNFPTVNPVQAANRGGAFDAFVLRMTTDGSSLVFSTYLGGSGDDRVVSIAATTTGTLLLAGPTNSINFPTVEPIQAAFAGGMFDGHVMQLSANGASILFSTYLGGSGQDRSAEVGVDSDGNVYVLGFTDSIDFPVVNAFQPSNAGGFDAWLVKIAW